MKVTRKTTSREIANMGAEAARHAAMELRDRLHREWRAATINTMSDDQLEFMAALDRQCELELLRRKDAAKPTESTVGNCGPVALSFRLQDSNGVSVETHQMEAPAAIAKITEFVRLHGTDPDMDGAGAKAGSITFAPVK